ncbi:hypothetical protein BCR43DRAFT_487213 [Syncephalastrum racemosum]|uniref:Uncharacterized protein n=1 Tax=Syncephalastrum racemosum TaxID=13706 RepID=A0A1X2HQJ9_SYNRA|nr:hypothetical protein BCR43DRAFT_487213 [Syncephalastrum racemosum]
MGDNYSDYTDEELLRLLELQRRERQRFYEGGDPLDFDLDRHDRMRHVLKRPAIPDMRFESTFDRSIETLQEQGASPLQIFWSAVVVNQFIMPFVNGFGWAVLSHMWRWHRIRAKYPARRITPSSSGETGGSSFLRGLKYGITQWSK